MQHAMPSGGGRGWSRAALAGRAGVAGGTLVRIGDVQGGAGREESGVGYADWPGVIDPEALSSGFVAEVHRLADAARAGAWPEVLEALDSSHWLTVNQWRIGSDSW